MLGSGATEGQISRGVWGCGAISAGMAGDAVLMGGTTGADVRLRFGTRCFLCVCGSLNLEEFAGYAAERASLGVPRAAIYAPLKPPFWLYAARHLFGCHGEVILALESSLQAPISHSGCSRKDVLPEEVPEESLRFLSDIAGSRRGKKRALSLPCSCSVTRRV